MTMDVYVGFDSAWTDNAKAPGAITAIEIDNGRVITWHPPHLVSFAGALSFINQIRSPTGVTLVALDQPTIVPNATSMRPVERAIASVVSWIGGGVQPSNRGRIGMFCDKSPVWSFLKSLGAIEDPEAAHDAKTGLYLVEVFPAAALPSIATESFGRLKGMKYNPQRKKTFKAPDWLAVAAACAAEAETFNCDELAAWSRAIGQHVKPSKADQDKLDAAICLLVALRWRLRQRQDSLMLGDMNTGYMVMPASPDVRLRLTIAAKKYQVPVDGMIPH